MLNFVGRLAAARSSSELGGGVKPAVGRVGFGCGAGASASASIGAAGSGSDSASGSGSGSTTSWGAGSVLAAFAASSSCSASRRALSETSPASTRACASSSSAAARAASACAGDALCLRTRCPEHRLRLRAGASQNGLCLRACRPDDGLRFRARIAEQRLGLRARSVQRGLRLRPQAFRRGFGLGASGGEDRVGLGAGRLEGRVRFRTRGARHSLGLGPGGGENAVGLGRASCCRACGALARGGNRRGGLLFDVAQPGLRLAQRLGRLPALLLELLLSLCRLFARRFEVALEVVELLFALVEGEPPQPDLLLGAREPILCRLLRVALDAVGELNRRPNELERLEPRGAAVRGEARGDVGKRRGSEAGARAEGARSRRRPALPPDEPRPHLFARDPPPSRSLLSGVDLAAQIDERLDGLGHERARLLRVGEAVRPRLGSFLTLRPSTSTSTTQASPRSRARMVTTWRPFRLALRTKSSRGSGSAAAGAACA